MAKKSIAQIHREIKKAKQREAQKLAKHLEIMGAAYCKATDIPPAEVTLVSREEEDGTRRYWYARFDKAPNLEECHPDIRYLFQLAMEIDRTNSAKNTEGVAKGVELLCKFVQYIGKEAANDDIKAVEEAKAKAEAEQAANSDSQDGGEVRVHGIE